MSRAIMRLLPFAFLLLISPWHRIAARDLLILVAHTGAVWTLHAMPNKYPTSSFPNITSVTPPVLHATRQLFAATLRAALCGM